MARSPRHWVVEQYGLEYPVRISWLVYQMEFCWSGGRKPASLWRLVTARFVWGQEDGLDSEIILLHRLERFRRLFLVLLMAIFFVIELEQLWAPVLLQWIRAAGSSTVGLAMDRGGHYLLLWGLQRLLDGRALLELLCIRPPPTRYLPRSYR